MSESGRRMTSTLTTTVRSAEALGQPPSAREILLWSPWSTTAKTAASTSGLRKGKKTAAVSAIAPTRASTKKYGRNCWLCMCRQYTKPAPAPARPRAGLPFLINFSETRNLFAVHFNEFGKAAVLRSFLYSYATTPLCCKGTVNMVLCREKHNHERVQNEEDHCTGCVFYALHRMQMPWSCHLC